MGRIRASSSEWRQYYERAARIRCLRGDPLRQLLRRRIVVGRIGKCMATCLAGFTFAVLVIGCLWLADHLTARAIAEVVTAG